MFVKCHLLAFWNDGTNYSRRAYIVHPAPMHCCCCCCCWCHPLFVSLWYMSITRNLWSYIKGLPWMSFLPMSFSFHINTITHLEFVDLYEICCECWPPKYLFWVWYLLNSMVSNPFDVFDSLVKNLTHVDEIYSGVANGRMLIREYLWRILLCNCCHGYCHTTILEVVLSQVVVVHVYPYVPHCPL